MFTYPVFASTTYSFSFSQPQISSNSCYVEVVFENWGPVVFYIGLTTENSFEPGFKYNPVDSAVFSCELYTASDGYNVLRFFPSYYMGRPVAAVECFGFYLRSDGTCRNLSKIDDSDISDNSYVEFWLGNSGRVLSANGYNCSVADLPHDFEFTFSYGTDDIISKKLDEILAALGSLNGQDFPSADEGLNSDISSIEDTESSLVSGSQGNYNSAVSSGTDSVLDFFNSAGSSLTMVRNVFNNLVSGNIWILVCCAIFLSILPLIVNVFRGFH